MEISKEEVIRGLYSLLSIGTMGPHAFSRRSRGFKSEIDFKLKCKKEKISSLDGGWFLFRKQDNVREPNKVAFVVVSGDDEKKYEKFFGRVSVLTIVRKMVFIKIKSHMVEKRFVDDEKKDRGEILFPELEVFEFKNGKFLKSELTEFLDFFEKKSKILYRKRDGKEIKLLDYLKEYDLDMLFNLYCNRFITDFLLRSRKVSWGSDFDGVLIKDDNFVIVETKEKDAGGKNRSGNPDDWFFGWDTRRLAWFLFVKMILNMECWYVIREINNQKERKLVDWKKISVIEFAEAADWGSTISGGVGMAPGMPETTIVPYRRFSSF